MRDENLPPVVVTSGKTANSLGVVRNFGRRGVEVLLLEATSESPARFSTYVKHRLRVSVSDEWNSSFPQRLIDWGLQTGRKAVMIPTADDEVLQISENRQKLEEFFLFVLADHWILQSCVEKRHFYPLVEKLGFPSPVTFVPVSLEEVETFSRELDFPFLVKPSRSLAFQERFHRKSFVIKGKEDLDRVIQALEGTGLQVLLQEIIPGNQFHEVYFYFNPRGKLVAQCGWDRIRQFPPGFGNGTFCRNIFRSEPAELGEAFLTKVGFCGLAAVEFVCDPRNHQFKLIEINPRTTLQNRLPAACGVDLEWLAYLDLIGKEVKPVSPPDTGNLWVDDFTDLLPRMARRVPDNSKSPPSPRRKVRSFACWDDPLPLLARMVFLLLNTCRLVRSRITIRISRLISRCTI